MNRAVNLTLTERYSYGLGAIGKDIVFAIISGYYMVYLTMVVELDPLVVGVFIALARGWDAFNDPIMGSFVDNTRSRWGKFRPWLAIGTVLNAIVVIIMLSDFSFPGLGDYYFYLSIYIVWGMTYTIVDIPYWSFIPAISGTKEERNSISALARIFASLGGGIAYAGMPIILKIYGYGREVFFTTGVVTACFFIFFMAFTVVFTKEKVFVISEKVKISDIVKVITKNDQLLAYIYSFGLFACATSILNNSAFYYFKGVLDREDLMTFFIILGGVGGMGVAMIAYPAMARRFSRRNIFIFSMLASISGFAVMSFFSFVFGGASFALAGLFIGGWLVMFSNGTASVGATVMLADVVDYGEWKNGNRTENITFSAQCFVYKFAMAVAAIVTGVALKLAGISAVDPTGVFTEVVTEAGKSILIFSIFTVPIFLIVPGLIFYIKLYKFTGDYQDEVLEDLYKKREEKLSG